MINWSYYILNLLIVVYKYRDILIKDFYTKEVPQVSINIYYVLGYISHFHLIALASVVHYRHNTWSLT